MCKSVRGAAYFGSSIHLAFSFVFLFWFVFDTLISEININLWKCEPQEQKFSSVNPLAHYLNLLFKLLYFTGLCVTGVYIFRGVERERPQLLKFATLAFCIIQMIGIVLFAVFFSIQWDGFNGEERGVPDVVGLETARLVGEETVPGKSSRVTNLESDNTDDTNDSLDQILRTVTPVISENVLIAPDLNDTTTTTPVPPPSPPVKVETIGTTTTTTTTAAPATTTKVPISKYPPVPCTTPECPHARSPPPLKPPVPSGKLPHNQLVRLVLQMCFAVTNGLVSVAYVIVIALYMLKL